MNQRDYKKLKELITKHVPGINEFTKHQKVINKISDEANHVFSDTDVEGMECAIQLKNKLDKVFWKLCKNNKKGRPIRLADILFVIDKKEKYTSCDYDGEFLLWRNDCNDTTDIFWDLKNNDLDKQKDETKQFLIDLLVEEQV